MKTTTATRRLLPQVAADVCRRGPSFHLRLSRAFSSCPDISPLERRVVSTTPRSCRPGSFSVLSRSFSHAPSNLKSWNAVGTIAQDSRGTHRTAREGISAACLPATHRGFPTWGVTQADFEGCGVPPRLHEPSARAVRDYCGANNAPIPISGEVAFFLSCRRSAKLTPSSSARRLLSTRPPVSVALPSEKSIPSDFPHPGGGRSQDEGNCCVADAAVNPGAMPVIRSSGPPQNSTALPGPSDNYCELSAAPSKPGSSESSGDVGAAGEPKEGGAGGEEARRQVVKAGEKLLQLCSGTLVPPPSLIQRGVNFGFQGLLSRLAPTVFEDFKQDFPSGAAQCLHHIANCVSHEQWVLLESCCENTLYDNIHQLLGILKDAKYQVTFELQDVRPSPRPVRLSFLVGARRGERLGAGRLIREQIRGAYVVRDIEEAEGRTNGRSAERVASELFDRGLLIIADGAVTARQRMFIEDSRGGLVAGRRDPINVTHLLRFEAQLSRQSASGDSPTTDESNLPNFTFGSNGDRFDAPSGWTLVDLNAALKGNFPIILNGNASGDGERPPEDRDPAK
eukprot:GHVT01077796.1.p1 GENE.GHVT01077796.1~~GHVT01077796.1.p1  ORF type:complete len:566 (-),score=43.63 GHVT01077796.1:973-2670(-)